MNPSVQVSFATEPFHRYFHRWAETGNFPTSLEYRQAKHSELHSRIWQCIADGPYSRKFTVETFPIVYDFTQLGWQQCNHWEHAIHRWLNSITLADQLRLSSEEVLA